MNNQHWEIIFSSIGHLHTDILRSLLEAQDIPVFVSQEGAGSALGLTIGPLGEVQLMVPSSHVGQARLVVAEYIAGAAPDDDAEDIPMEDMEDMDEG